MTARQQLGVEGEALACAHLERQGYQVIGRNVRVGRCELDLIATRGRLVVFCEVRTRRSDALLDPAETIDRGKVGRVRKAAAQWLSAQELRFDQVRFDAASVVLSGASPALRYFEDAF